MKFVHEYRDAALAQDYARAIAQILSRPWTIMEICGGQTHAIVKYGVDELLPPGLELIHGPGCPVCVTAAELIDQAIAIAHQPGVILCSFGDMLRVPGHHLDLLAAKAQGADVRIIYSPLDCLKLAREQGDRPVVFFGVGFETTAPATAMAVYQAQQQGLTNFFLLAAHVLVPPAMAAILSDPDCRVQGFLAAGHVCTVMGYEAYEALANRYQVPIVVTGFEPIDILAGLHRCVQQLEAGRAECENQYARSVQRSGNPTAQQLMQQVFQVVPRVWRGLGTIPASGLGLRPEFAAFDAQQRFAAILTPAAPSTPVSECISGAILRGQQKPPDCPAFGTGCTPDHPLGAPMVSSEGACAAYFRYRHHAAGVVS